MHVVRLHSRQQAVRKRVRFRSSAIRVWIVEPLRFAMFAHLVGCSFDIIVYHRFFGLSMSCVLPHAGQMYCIHFLPLAPLFTVIRARCSYFRCTCWRSVSLIQHTIDSVCIFLRMRLVNVDGGVDGV